VPGEFWDEARQMATAGAIVAAIALPAGVASWMFVRARTQPMLPACRPWRVPWTGFELFGAFVLVGVIVPTLVAQAGVKPIVAGLAALPLQLALLVIAARSLYPRWNPFRDPQPTEPDDWAYSPPPKHAGANVPGFVAIAVVAWAVLTPLVLLFHVGVVQLFTALNWVTDEHPLTQFRGETPFDQVLFMLQACLAAPLMEEILFRGLLLPWVIGGRERAAGTPSPPLLVRSFARPWLVMAIAVLVAANTRKPGPILFAALLAFGLVIVWVTVRRGKRQIRAIYASSALFAAVHSGVWPSPIPLFLLALGVGYLAVRTRGVLVPFLVHGLFNAVSAVYVLRSGAG
jgi:membrane protease YdiL (CAAX protease family)